MMEQNHETLIESLPSGPNGIFANTIFFFLIADQFSSCTAVVNGNRMNFEMVQDQSSLQNTSFWKISIFVLWRELPSAQLTAKVFCQFKKLLFLVYDCTKLQILFDNVRDNRVFCSWERNLIRNNCVRDNESYYVLNFIGNRFCSRQQEVRDNGVGDGGKALYL